MLCRIAPVGSPHLRRERKEGRGGPLHGKPHDGTRRDPLGAPVVPFPLASNVDTWHMTLVEWTRLEPGQVEATVAMLLNSERPTSVRITPSRGDGGVDILDRGGADDGGDVVYQVKSYTAGLTARQKASIKDSFDTLLEGERWQDLNLTSWRLVTPWNPSPEAEHWLQELGTRSGVPVVWHGLDFIERLAGKYPDVLDYYLRGGATTIKAAQVELLTLMGLDRAAESSLTVEEVSGRVQTALGVLNHDPHYRFEFRFGEGTPPAPSDRPGLVLHSMLASSRDSRWIVVDVIARCAASPEVRPITVNGTIPAGEDTETARDWQEFMTFGAPFLAGGVTGELDAPGGLGGRFEDATMFAGPAVGADLGGDRELHLEILDPSDAVVAEANVDRVEVSRGVLGGIRSVLRETNGIFELEGRWNIEKQTGTHELRVKGVTGLPVTVALDGVRFLSELQAPNLVRISHRHGARSRGALTDQFAFPRDEETTAGLNATLRILETLVRLQEHAGGIIRTPDFRTVPPEQFRVWRISAAVASGEEISGKYDNGQAFLIDLPTEANPDETLRVSLPHKIRVADQHVDLGRYELVLENPSLVQRVPIEGGFRHAFLTKDQRFIWRRGDPSLNG